MGILLQRALIVTSGMFLIICLTWSAGEPLLRMAGRLLSALNTKLVILTGALTPNDAYSTLQGMFWYLLQQNTARSVEEWVNPNLLAWPALPLDFHILWLGFASLFISQAFVNHRRDPGIRASTGLLQDLVKID